MAKDEDKKPHGKSSSSEKPHGHGKKGHGHHHEHDHHDHDGHDHEHHDHEHEHSHGKKGHEHDHDHGHDHAHDHHEHGHDHEHGKKGHGHHHDHDHDHHDHHDHADSSENPSIVSFERNYKIIPADGVRSELIIASLDLLLTELASILRSATFMIGHIKGFVTFDHGGSIGLSIVKKVVNHKGVNYNSDTITKSFKLALTNIVFKVDEDELWRLVELGLAVALPKTLVEEVQVIEEEKKE